MLAFLHLIEQRPTQRFKAWWIKHGYLTTNNKKVRITLEIIGVTAEAAILNAIAGFWVNNIITHLICNDVAIYIPWAGPQMGSLVPWKETHRLDPFYNLGLKKYQANIGHRNSEFALRHTVVEDQKDTQPGDEK